MNNRKYDCKMALGSAMACGLFLGVLELGSWVQDFSKGDYNFNISGKNEIENVQQHKYFDFQYESILRNLK